MPLRLLALSSLLLAFSARAADEKPAPTAKTEKPPEKAAEAPVAQSEAPLLAFDKSSLDNGLEVLVHEDKRVPLACISVWYHAGSYDEDPGKTGFAHLFEHLMFQGSLHVKDDSHQKFLEAAGGSSINGSTDFDRTNYVECVPKNEIELALWLEADRMGWLMEGVDKSKLDAQRGVVKNERRENVENQPYGLADEQLWQAMFPKDHPYWGDIVGSMVDLDKASLDDVHRFYDRYYAPSDATIAIAGDVDTKATKALVEKYFKSLPKWPKPTKKTVKAPSLDKEVKLEVDDALASVAKVEVEYFTPAIFQPGDADMMILAHVLGDGNASHLHQALVVDSQLATDVSATQMSRANVSVFSVSATVKPGVDPETVLNAIQAQIELLVDIPPGADEIERSVSVVEASTIFALEQPLDRAELLQHYNHYTGDPGYLAKDLARFHAVTPDTLGEAIKKYLGKEHRAVLVAKPKSSAPPADAKPDAPATGGAK